MCHLTERHTGETLDLTWWLLTCASRDSLTAQGLLFCSWVWPWIKTTPSLSLHYAFHHSLIVLIYIKIAIEKVDNKSSMNGNENKGHACTPIHMDIASQLSTDSRGYLLQLPAVQNHRCDLQIHSVIILMKKSVVFLVFCIFKLAQSVIRFVSNTALADILKHGQMKGFWSWKHCT